ncbi:MAG: TasA family protein [Bacilli bacterium]|nr:TasA family protein [Bacilli bacterium]
MKKSKLIVLIVSLVVVLAAATYGITSAWLTDTDNEAETFTMGDVNYALSGALVANTNPIVPGQDLVGTDFVVTNASTVASQLRIQITYTTVSGGTPTTDIIYTGATGGDGIVTDISASTWTYSNNYWYLGATADDTIAVNTTAYTMFTSLSYNGALIGNDYQAATGLTITITFQAKQDGYVDWADMGSIDFSTGLAE